MYLLPYETAICQKLYPKVTGDIVNKIKRVELDMKLPEVATPLGYKLQHAVFVTPSDEHELVPQFTQYLDIGTPKDPKLVIHGGQYMSIEKRTGTYRLVASGDWKLQCVRMALNMHLLNGDEAFFSRFTDLPVKVFSRWLAATLTKQYNLGIESQMAMYVIGAYYYYAMFTPEMRQPGDDRERAAINVSRVTGVPIDAVLNQLTTMGPLRNVDDLCHEFSTNANTIRIGKLTSSALFVLVHSSWFGVNARENVAVALEHLPTFLALLYMAVDDRSYRNSGLTSRVENAARGNEMAVFVDLVSRAVSDYYVE
jgi:hypothetical protein